MMKPNVLFLLLVALEGLLSLNCTAQYYYKDQILTRQTIQNWRHYKDAGIRSVALSSFENDGRPSDGFLGEQTIAKDYSRITTHTRATGTTESWIITNYTPAGLPRSVLDTSDTYRSSSEYQFDAEGHITSIINSSLETDNKLKESEVHIWTYNPDHPSTPSSMLKIRNGADTTTITFILDEKGNVAEERSSRHGQELPTIYYYYDDNNRLTDIVRYNVNARRLLPDRIFTYEQGELPVSMLVVQEGSNEYQKWIYTYDTRGLKSQERCFNKQKQLLGRIEYKYQ